MARAVSSDLLNVFKFSLRDLGYGLVAAGGDVFGYGGGEAGGIGFASVGALEMSGELQEIKEGTWSFPHYVMQRATCGRVRLTRGMVGKDSDFYNWFTTCLFGNLITRRNLLLSMNGRDNLPQKSWILHQCIPAACTVWPELDAKSSEIAVAALEIQPEYIEEVT